jgi:hypothetical protein
VYFCTNVFIFSTYIWIFGRSDRTARAGWSRMGLGGGEIDHAYVSHASRTNHSF